jgi:2-polyprenyl-3-methyl-5-hydroxy-6-metoxy-1,4-benzoquinol methylase
MSDVLWRRLQYFMTPQMDLYRNIAAKVAGLKVIDIGCGTGLGTLQLKRWTDDVTGVDIDRDSIGFARDTIPGIRWEWADAGRTLHYIGNDYDAVLMIEVLEHISDWQEAVANVWDVLKPGGKLYISARNANADLRKNDLHEREWTAHQFHTGLSHYFKGGVTLWDWKLENEQGLDTRQTPLVAVARKEA